MTLMSFLPSPKSLEPSPASAMKMKDKSSRCFYKKPMLTIKLPKSLLLNFPHTMPKTSRKPRTSLPVRNFS